MVAVMHQSFTERVKYGVIDKEIYSFMRKTGDIIGGLIKFTEMRKKYWSDYYYDRSRSIDDKSEKIVYQLYGKFFKFIKVILKRGKQNVFIIPEIYDKMYEVAKAYIRKRLTFKEIKDRIRVKASYYDQHGDFSKVDLVKSDGERLSEYEVYHKFYEESCKIPKATNHSVMGYASLLDRYMKWDVKLMNVLSNVIEKSDELKNDVVTIFLNLKDCDLKYVPVAPKVKKVKVVKDPDPVVEQKQEEVQKAFGEDIVFDFGNCFIDNTYDSKPDPEPEAEVKVVNWADAESFGFDFSTAGVLDTSDCVTGLDLEDAISVIGHHTRDHYLTECRYQFGSYIEPHQMDELREYISLLYQDALRRGNVGPILGLEKNDDIC
eukprot:TRINITY_DN2045_c0_g2_i6.p1 TRINITY_DN2045_c0_g2~~TRINITY_DN2045_c0_g2_i6.p1  ORF type:complete len:376 (+),score=16.04 TRINITY_DN2045_c0_g2_i6:103-1230(+)